MKLRLLAVSLVAPLLLSGLFAAAKPKPGVAVDNGYKGKGGETQMVQVKGVAQITTSGPQDAFNNAIAQAMRKAVEQVLGAMVKSETLVKNGSVVEDKIYAKASGFVQKYELVAEARKGSAYEVEIKAWVVLGDVKDDAMALGLLQDRVGRPKVLVIIDEKALDTQEAVDNAKSAIMQRMQAKQFEFVDEEQLKKVLAAKNLQISQLSGISADLLQAVAVDAGAQVIIKGKVVASKGNLAATGIAGMENWTSIQSSLTVDAIYAADASIIASKSATGKGANISVGAAQTMSVGKAANAAAGELIDAIIKRWDDFVNNGFEYSLTAANCDFSASSALQEGLEKNIEGVKKVFDKGFNDSTKTQEFTVRYTGLPRELAKAMLSAGKLSVKVKIKQVTSKSILLEVLP